MAVRLALDERRSRARGERLIGRVAEVTRDHAVAPHDGSEAGHDLDRALRTLPKGARAIFVLHDVEGHRHEEIATMLGIEVGTSKSQLHRARRLLRVALTCTEGAET